MGDHGRTFGRLGRGDFDGAIGGLVTNGINRLAEIATRLMGTLASVRDARGLMNDPRLPGGHWPQAVNL
ncbi:hypothetical protein [Amycolatopsis sp. cmx-4-68]|uniref:hypothetical protein n=1 Tax=Amycolatopsis sp. cmx-4-68 TaxID=2790938 RepID=UPI00397E16AE